MSATVEEATDEVFALFRTYWLENTPTLNNGQAPEIRWQGVAYRDVPKLPYSLASIVDVGRPLETIADSENVARFQRSGFVNVQVRVPLGEGDAFGIRLATVARNAFERRPTDSGLFFFDCEIHRHTESETDPYAQFTVTANFSYGENK